MIHVCYGLYDKDGRYSKFVGTSMLSIFENTQADVTVHIIHDNTLNDSNRDKFNYLAGRYNQQVRFYNVDVLIHDKINLLNEKIPQISKRRFSIGTFYRLLIPELISVDKTISRIIYLDADILVNLDINELWSTNLGDSPLAAVPEMIGTFGLMLNNKFIVNSGIVKREEYFNAGVLLIDLNKINSSVDLFNDGLDFLVKNPECDCFDQDILNNFFASSYLKLPLKFDFFVDSGKIKKPDSVIEKNIYHFSDRVLNVNLNDIYNRLYFEYFVKTPWFNIDTLNNIFNSIQKIYNDNKHLLIQMTKLISGRKRAFFTEERNVESLKKACAIKEDEQIILADEMPDSIDELVKFIKSTQRKNVVFIFVKKYNFVRDILIKNNCIEYLEFLNGVRLLPTQKIAPFNSHFIVRDM